VPEAPDNSGKPAKPVSAARIALAFAVFLGAVAALLFLPAGRWDWTAGWLYMAIVTIFSAVNYAALRLKNPELIAHRMRFGKGTKTWDKAWLALSAPVWCAIYLVAGLDAARFAWSAMPLLLWPVGLAVFLAGAAVVTWSMAVNPFFETTVRIQSERGHRVVDAGPYRLVRHPGYLGFLGWLLSAPLLLGSWWAFLPAILSVVLLVLRTGLEDRTLRKELPGYRDYAGRVRFRLVPWLW